MERLTTIASLEERLGQSIWIKTYMSNYLKVHLMAVFTDGSFEVLMDDRDEYVRLDLSSNEVVIFN